jgi:sugar lactone lactonase YvrE
MLSFIGSFTDLRGGDIYPALIRKTEPKPIRVFLQDGNHDLNNFAGDWWLANQSMASALTYAGYDVKFVTGDKDHDMIQGGAVLPDALRWLWRDYPQPIPKPALHHLGDRQTGFVEVDKDWALVGMTCHVRRQNEGTYKVDFGSEFGDAEGIAVDGPGNVFISDSTGKSICRIDLAGQGSTFAAGVKSARGLAFGPDGRLYGCDSDGIVSYASNGKKSVRLRGVDCKGIAVTRAGGLYFTESFPRGVAYLPPGNSTHYQSISRVRGMPPRDFSPNGMSLSPDQSIIYISDPKGRWVWPYQVQADGMPGNEEPFFRMETPDESSESGASGMAVDSQGLLYVATLMGIQVCDQQGSVVAILDGPVDDVTFFGGVSGLTFGGPDHQYLYVVVGNDVYRRHLVRKGGS